VISSSQGPLPDDTKHSQQTNIHALGEIRTHSFSRRAASDLRLIPRGHWDRLLFYKPESNRKLGWPAGRWLDSGQENPKIKGFRNWGAKVAIWGQWGEAVRQAQFVRGFSARRRKIENQEKEEEGYIKYFKTVRKSHMLNITSLLLFLFLRCAILRYVFKL